MDRGPLRRTWSDGPVELWRDGERLSYVWCTDHRLVGVFDPRVEDELLREIAAWHLRKEHRR